MVLQKIPNTAGTGDPTDLGTGNSIAVTYVPSTDYPGAAASAIDTFTVKVTDGEDTDTVVVNVTVEQINDRPVIVVEELSTDEDTAIEEGQITATDAEEVALRYWIEAQATKGVLELNTETGAFTYTPNENENGNDTFTVGVEELEGADPLSQTAEFLCGHRLNQ